MTNKPQKVSLPFEISKTILSNYDFDIKNGEFELKPFEALLVEVR